MRTRYPPGPPDPRIPQNNVLPPYPAGANVSQTAAAMRRSDIPSTSTAPRGSSLKHGAGAESGDHCFKQSRFHPPEEGSFNQLGNPLLQPSFNPQLQFDAQFGLNPLVDRGVPQFNYEVPPGIEQLLQFEDQSAFNQHADPDGLPIDGFHVLVTPKYMSPLPGSQLLRRSDSFPYLYDVVKDVNDVSAVCLPALPGSHLRHGSMSNPNLFLYPEGVSREAVFAELCNPSPPQRVKTDWHYDVEKAYRKACIDKRGPFSTYTSSFIPPEDIPRWEEWFERMQKFMTIDLPAYKPPPLPIDPRYPTQSTIDGTMVPSTHEAISLAMRDFGAGPYDLEQTIYEYENNYEFKAPNCKRLETSLHARKESDYEKLFANRYNDESFEEKGKTTEPFILYPMEKFRGSRNPYSKNARMMDLYCDPRGDDSIP